MKAGPGCECQPVEPPGAIVVVRTTVSVGALEKILKLGEVSWNGATLIRPSVVLVTPEGGVAHATPATVNGARNRKPAMMMTMRFMCVQSLLCGCFLIAGRVAARECPMWPEIGLRTWTIRCPCPVRKRRCRGGPGGKAQFRPAYLMEAGKSGSGGQPGVQSWHRRAADGSFASRNERCR